MAGIAVLFSDSCLAPTAAPLARGVTEHTAELHSALLGLTRARQAGAARVEVGNTDTQGPVL